MSVKAHDDRPAGDRDQGPGDGGMPGRGDGEIGGQGEMEVQKLEPAITPQSSDLSPAKLHGRHGLPRPVIALAVLALAAAGYWYYAGVSAPSANGVTASGTIETEEVSIASEVAGRVVQLNADEGDAVQAGELLAKLDDSTLQLQYRMAASPADRQLLELQIEKTSIRSPLDGVVIRRSLHVGEVASPGATIMVVTQVDPVELTLYVPESQIGQVKLGQKVDVRVDSFPNDNFQGEVTFISGKAEFTPRNVQTQKDRVNLVFAVKVRIPNADQRLKPGVPADATFLGVGGQGAGVSRSRLTDTWPLPPDPGV
jgi:multidrug resistance efflux pump